MRDDEAARKRKDNRDSSSASYQLRLTEKSGDRSAERASMSAAGLIALVLPEVFKLHCLGSPSGEVGREIFY